MKLFKFPIKKRIFNKKSFNLLFLFLFVLSFIIPFQSIIENNNRQLTNDREIIIDYEEKIRSSAPTLSFYSFQIDDDSSGSSQGDNDGNIDAGETIELRITLENTGDEDALNVNATISSSNSNITFSNGFQDYSCGLEPVI